MRRRPSRNAMRGIALIEMMFCLVLIVGALTVGARIFQYTMRTYQDAPAAEARMLAQTQWLAALRRDAWGANRITIDGNGLLTFTMANEQPVAWRIDRDGRTLIREAGDELVGDLEQSRWPIDRPLRARWSDTGVLTLDVQGADAPFVLATPTRKAGWR